MARQSTHAGILHARRLARSAARNYDFILTIATIALAVLIGALFVAATVYTFFAAQAEPAWAETSMYSDYIDTMNACLFPLLVALLVALGLCIPRRVLKKRVLVAASVALVATTLVLTIAVSQRAGWLFLLASAAIIQLVVIAMTAIRSPRLTYLQESFLVRIGSALLHLGLIVLVAAFVVRTPRASQLTTFWIATALIMLGMIMSLYSTELGVLGRLQRARPRRSGDAGD